MDISALLNDKSIKPKEKTDRLAQAILSKDIKIAELISAASGFKEPLKATCIEAIEFATKDYPELVDKDCFEFIVRSLKDKAPRIKWESARVIMNTAHLFKNNLDDAISNLLVNTEHQGTVVRWSAASALGQILILKTSHNKALLPAFEAIISREEKNSIIKIYAAAIKKVGK